MSGSILVGVTTSSASTRAVDWAGVRARDLGQPVTLFSIVGGVVGAVGEQELVDAALDAAQELVVAEAARLRESGVDVSTRVDIGNPVAQLIDASADAAMLVVGSDYRGPGSGEGHGTHGTRIAAGAHVPVAVVPDIDLEGRTGVVVGADDSPASEKALAFAAREAARLREPLIVVGVWTPMETRRDVQPDAYLTNLRKMTESALFLAVAPLRREYPGLRVELRAEGGRPASVINEIAQDARLAVVGTHGRGAIARFLLGSTSQEVLGRLATATVIVR